MKSLNLFQINYKTSLEDKFTSSLTYLLNKYPSLGQAYVDRVCVLTGQNKSTFKVAIDHPALDARCFPDFAIHTSDVKFLFEHKIESGLGENQLEKYLKVAEKSNHKLCFVTNQLTEISSEVLNTQLYLKQMNRDHLVWTDLFDVFGKREEHLIFEFQEWMRELGMSHDSYFAHGDPFVEDAAAQDFVACSRDLNVLIPKHLGELKGRKVTKRKYCFTITNALSQIYLVYVGLEKVPVEWEYDLSGKCLVYDVILKDPKALSPKEGILKTKLGDIQYYPGDGGFKSWLKDVEKLFSTRLYFIELDKIFDENDASANKKNIEEITLNVLKHLKQETEK